MCLAISGRIVEVDEGLQLAKAEVAASGEHQHRPVHGDGDRIEIGDWVLIHVGFAMSKIDETEAQRTLEALEEIGAAYEQEMDPRFPN